MTYHVRVTPSAKEDIRKIAQYISKNDSPGKSRYVVGEIRKKIQTLNQFPERGGRPVELLLMNDDRDYREILFGPYRIFYQIRDKTVFVVAVADGRRDMIAFLLERFGEK